MFRKTRKETVNAFHDDDLENILEGLGVLKKFKNGELKCKICNKIVTFQNLHSIFPQSGSIKFVCDNNNCTSELYRMLREGGISL